MTKFPPNHVPLAADLFHYMSGYATKLDGRSISPTEAMPVEMMTGLPVSAASRISGRSTISEEAIL